MRLCIVTEFEQGDFFQWTVALETTPKIMVDSVVINPEVLNCYSSDSPYWDVIKNADVVFVYCVRHNRNWKWYELPIIAKRYMKPKAKMICQFDLEFLWLWHPNHFPWKEIDQWSDGKTPEEFFAETSALEVADAYIVFFNPHLENFIHKPVYGIPLPQLVRHEAYLSEMKEPSYETRLSRRKKGGNVVILKHSVRSASYKHTLDNIIKELKFPVTIFTYEHTGTERKKKMFETLQRGSHIYGKVSRNAYIDLLEKGFIAIDDNEGYSGWSRFAMECAITCVPCIGSTLAVKEFFPKLYVEHKDYKTQIKLIKKLYTDRKFWLRMAKSGRKNVLKKMKTKYLVKHLLAVIDSVVKTTSEPFVLKKIKKINAKYKIVAEYKKYLAFKKNHFPKSIPLRPNEGTSVYDAIHKDIFNQEQWDMVYDMWRDFIDGKVPDEELVSSFSREQRIQELAVSERKISDSGVKFSIIIPVSRTGEVLERCLNSVERQNANEIRAYVDPIKIAREDMEDVMLSLERIGAEVFLQALTSDSDEKKCRRRQKKAVKKIFAEGKKRRCDLTKKFLETGLPWNIHHSAHPDCVRNVHRAILECENKWVIRVDDDDEILVNIRDVLNEFANDNVGIIHGDRCDINPSDNSHKTIRHGYPVKSLKDLQFGIRGSVVIINRDAFKEVHSNMSHEPWQDFRRWYWILRAGYKAVYVPKIFCNNYRHALPDPIRLAEGGGVTWKNIMLELDKKHLRV